MNIGLLGCDDVPERFRHLAGTYRDMFEALLAPHIPDARFTWFAVSKGELPPCVEACDAYVCTGSRNSVYEEREWIARLKDFVCELHRSRTRYVGVCFGHQMLAEALGGTVTLAEYGWGVGVHDMTIVEPAAWMQPRETHCKIQYMHSDQVEHLPPGSTVLARAAHCPVAMFQVGDTMLGIEGHPEFGAPYVEALLLNRREKIGAERVDAALASLQEPTQHVLAARWISNFLLSGDAAK